MFGYLKTPLLIKAEEIIDDVIFDKKVLMTQLSQTNFDYSTILNNKSLNKLITNYADKIVVSKPDFFSFRIFRNSASELTIL